MKKLTYSFWDVLMADPYKPIPEEKRQRQLTRMYIALIQIEKGDKPMVDDLALVSDAVELTDNFYSAHAPTDAAYNALAKDIWEARRALLDAYVRHQRHQSGAAIRLTGIGMQAVREYYSGAAIRLTGTGMQAVREVMSYYYQVLHTVPERTVIQLHRATELANIKSLKEGNAVILKGTK